MSDSLLFLLRAAEDTLRFTYAGGDVTFIEQGHTTGWRTMPVGMAAHILHSTSRCETSDGQVQIVRDGETLFIPPGVTHKIEKIDTSPGLSRWSHFSCSIFQVVDLFSLLTVPMIFTGTTATQIGDLNADLSQLHKLETITPYTLLKRKALGFLLVTALTEQASVEGERMREFGNLQQLTPVLCYIEAHLDGPLSREELAGLVGVSPSHFYSIFKGALGISPRDYVQQLRLRNAQEMLLSTELSVNEIARKCGYEDVFHFSRLFKKRYGLSPAWYREHGRKGLL